MHGVEARVSSFPLSAVRYISLNPSFVNVNQPKSAAASNVYQAGVINIFVKNYGRGPGLESMRNRGKCGGRLLYVVSI
jgi:hypothetical protein